MTRKKVALVRDLKSRCSNARDVITDEMFSDSLSLPQLRTIVSIQTEIDGRHQPLCFLVRHLYRHVSRMEYRGLHPTNPYTDQPLTRRDIRDIKSAYTTFMKLTNDERRAIYGD